MLEVQKPRVLESRLCQAFRAYTSARANNDALIQIMYLLVRVGIYAFQSSGRLHDQPTQAIHTGSNILENGQNLRPYEYYA